VLLEKRGRKTFFRRPWRRFPKWKVVWKREGRAHLP